MTGSLTYHLRASAAAATLLAGLPTSARAAPSAAAAAVAADATQQAASGQNAPGPPNPTSPATVEQVTVTALKQRANLQRTPVAISVVSGSTLDRVNAATLQGLNGLVPSLTITQAAGFENLVNIRGVGSSTPENALVSQPGVSFFEDGVYIANSIALDQALFDVDRVEVLRGPQGSLYGQSSTGGVINLVSNQPVIGQYSGHADWGIGNDDLFQERAAVNLPVGNQVAIRVGIQKYDHDGFAQSVSPPIAGYGLDNAHNISGKVAILWRPSDNFSATFTAQWFRAVQDGAEQKNIDDPVPDPRLVSQDYPGQFNLDTDLYHLNLEWTLPFAVIRSVTAYQHLYNVQSEDSSRLSYAILGSYDDIADWNTDIDSETEDLNIASKPRRRLEWVGGVFLMHQRATQFVAEFEGKNPNPDLTVSPDITSAIPANLAYGNITDVSRNSIAPYLQSTLHITRAVRLTGGIRYNQDSYNDFAYNFASSGSSKTNTDYTTGRLTGNVNLQWDATPVNMLYGSVTEGYKPGGINSNNGAVVVSRTFVPEGITSFEVGAKNRFLDNSLLLNVAAFFYDYRNLQYIEEDPVPFEYGITNIPDTHIWGGEAEGTYLMFDGRLRLNGQLTLEDGSIMSHAPAIDSKTTANVYAATPACLNFGNYSNPACWAAVIAAADDPHGNQPPLMPNVQGELNVQYTWPIWRGSLLTRAEFIYRGPAQARVFNDPATDHVPAYTLWNLYLSYKPDRSRWTVALALTNLANMAGVASRYTDPYGTSQTSDQYVPPFQAVGTIGYSF